MPGLVHVQTTINDVQTDFLAEPRQSLLEVLRDVLGKTGTKEGCNDGNCGACTVILDGRIVDSCLVLAVETQGSEVTTIEGLATADGLHPIQQAFLVPVLPGLVHVQTTINDVQTDFLAEPRQSLLEVLRDVLGKTGTKEGCNDGNCGACTVILDGRIVDSCLVLAVETQGSEVTTIEGLATADGLHPIQQAFLEQAALQCGICTPGFIVASKGLLDQEPDADEGRIRHWLAGNLCRCTGYDKIIRAVLEAEKLSK